MSIWIRLFGQSNSSQSKNRPRLGLQSLEMREVPAVLGGASAHEFPWQVSTRPDASAGVVEWGASMDPRDVGSLTTPEPRPEPVVTVEYLILGIEYSNQKDTGRGGVNAGNEKLDVLDDGAGADRSTGGCGNDTLIGGVGDDIWYLKAGNDELQTDPSDSTAASRPLPVLMVIADQRDFSTATAGAGRDVLIAQLGDDRIALASDAELR